MLILLRNRMGDLLDLRVSFDSNYVYSQCHHPSFPFPPPTFLFQLSSSPVRNDGENYPPFNSLAVFGGFFCLNLYLDLLV